MIRQQDPQEHAALEALHDGNPDRYLAFKDRSIAVHVPSPPRRRARRDGVAAVGHRPRRGVMIARDNHTREQLNAAARERLKPSARSRSRRIIGGKEFAVGDRVIARRNDRQLDVDNGTLATVVAIDTATDRVRVRTDSGDDRELGARLRRGHLEHAYALTAHGAQGATVAWAGVIGRPRSSPANGRTPPCPAREQTTLHVIAQPGRHGPRASAVDRARDHVRTEAMTTLRRAMVQADSEALALEHAPFEPRWLSVARQIELDRLAEADLRRALQRSDRPAILSPRRPWSQAAAPSPLRMTR